MQTIISFNKHLPVKRVNSGKRNQKHIANGTEIFKKNTSKKADVGEINYLWKESKYSKQTSPKQTHIRNVSTVLRSQIHFSEGSVDKWI